MIFSVSTYDESVIYFDYCDLLLKQKT